MPVFNDLSDDDVSDDDSALFPEIEEVFKEMNLSPAGEMSDVFAIHEGEHVDINVEILDGTRNASNQDLYADTTAPTSSDKTSLISPSTSLDKPNLSSPPTSLDDDALQSNPVSNRLKNIPTNHELSAISDAENAGAPHPMSFDDDLSSVRSHFEDSYSTSSDSQSLRYRAAEIRFSDLLSQRPEMNKLIEQACAEMPRDRVQRNLGRLLYVYYLGLSMRATSHLSRRASQLLRSKRRREYIAAKVVSYICPESNEQFESGLRELRANVKDMIDIEISTRRWLAEMNPDDPILLDIDESPDQSSDDGQSDDDENDPNDQNTQVLVEPLALIPRMERFLMLDHPIKGLEQELRLFLLPTTYKHFYSTIKETPHQPFLCSYTKSVFVVDKIKAAVEDFTGAEWIWWPLSQCNRQLRAGDARVSWFCVSAFATWFDSILLIMHSTVALVYTKTSPSRLHKRLNSFFITRRNGVRANTSA